MNWSVKCAKLGLKYKFHGGNTALENELVDQVMAALTIIGTEVFDEGELAGHKATVVFKCKSTTFGTYHRVQLWVNTASGNVTIRWGADY